MKLERSEENHEEAENSPSDLNSMKERSSGTRFRQAMGVQCLIQLSLNTVWEA